MTVVLPAMTHAQEGAWRALLRLHEMLGSTWCLVGGQMVHLYCAERGIVPPRQTEDADTVLDVRARPDILRAFAQALIDLGWSSAGESPDGHQHRWLKGDSEMDVLVPTSLGVRAANRRGATGGTTLATPGGQQPLDRAEIVSVQVAEKVGNIPRPNLAGALGIKAAAYLNASDRRRVRHLQDFALLASMGRREDHLSVTLRQKDVAYLAPVLSALAANPALVAAIDEADRGLDALAGLVRGL